MTLMHVCMQRVCDKHDPEFHPRFKQWADDYFLIKHRNERRGLGAGPVHAEQALPALFVPQGNHSCGDTTCWSSSTNSSCTWDN